MQSLLTWSIQNSTQGQQGPSVDQQKLDPEIIDMILGRPDSQLMKESLAIALDENRSEDDRIDALDQFEMLIEQIDNANNLQKLQLWEPLQSLLISDNSSPEIKTAVLWIIGTALQNNPAAQDDYMQYHPLPALLNFLTPAARSTLKTRSKAMYALSGLLKHNAPAVDALSSLGWTTLRDALQDPDISVRRKTIFLLSALLVPNDIVASQNTLPNVHGPESLSSAADNSSASHASTQPVHPNSHAAHLLNPRRTSTTPQTLQAFQKYGILDAVISSLVNIVPYGEDGDQEGPDSDFEEKGMRLLHIYLIQCRTELTGDQRKMLGPWVGNELKSAGSEKALAERWCFDLDELRALVNLTRA
ncbi:adenyl-nucleotide exchange factor [Amanita rubescens]|nr:adenyl-nucleotide exchange factor [Amanita rubescens]